MGDQCRARTMVNPERANTQPTDDEILNNIEYAEAGP